MPQHHSAAHHMRLAAKAKKRGDLVAYQKHLAEAKGVKEKKK